MESQFSIQQGEPSSFSRCTPSNLSAKFTYGDIRQQYVPSPALDNSKTPDILNIMNLTKRMYLHHKEVERITHEVEEKEAIFTQDLDAKHFLDLGANPLQRIIDDMKSLTARNAVGPFDPNAARNSGLESYCDYLTAKKQHDIEDRDAFVRKIRQLSCG